ncbi:hypothetical protein DPMN_110690 [Dreissena polymorpha]|uniref:Uncharacterized protein n=1 Tax=Dreissena polymorpha TaxID=45954 RepID=A0A9D4KDA4_DREPO|nr:hypothetical protein DPMN_110690 [Dreissena polymorpha]
MNDIAERLFDLYATSKLAIGGSVFHHRRIHKATLVSPNLSTKIISTTCASQLSFVAFLRIYVPSDEQTWLRTVISLSPDRNFS